MATDPIELKKSFEEKASQDKPLMYPFSYFKLFLVTKAWLIDYNYYVQKITKKTLF